ncbi:NAD(P)-dependent dehydrogenase, short-chain alcohol dehydrogenase family [Lentzea xinjiangensis]|uniref:NAD(P)-dependent dehydrogenase, short-chain alcohol dehydrogenase family n=1 Tax=Lentzea xinjiangensis TaxID=402600 RepID=A0A1H9SWG1_9PSEU|nr:SDR family oxidoreductase [Lentzea xinjiangensis]SER89154.1 NAD(P)-dependent dehydrogenase, short-chain alcohol dehydrogenase family [Lentzea xinjiangensis]
MPSGVIITGASRGVGRATAVAFAERGHRVAVHYGNRREDAEDTVARLAGDGHAVIGGDLADPDAARDLVAEAVRALGAVDVLVNNAGVAPTDRNRHRLGDTAWDEWTDAWRSMFAVNLMGAVNVTWAVAQHLIDRGAPGSIVNVGSRGAFRGEPDYPAYGASKAALHAFGQSAAVALAPHGISVTSVAPGFIATERQAGKLAGEEGDAVRDQSPFGRVGTPEEIAAAIVHLASPEAAWSSGTVLDLNGASYLRT